MSQARLKEARDRLQRLQGLRDQLEQQRRGLEARLGELRQHLDVAPEVADTLDGFSQQLFGDLVELLREKLSLALQEVLQQPLQLEVTCRYLRGAAAMEFHILRDGQAEDILRGQGGSVANVLSVGLRLFALTTLEPQAHRRFLVLDEQDCWLHPALVPGFVRIIHQASQALGFQVLMISHHDAALFGGQVDRLYRLEPGRAGVKLHKLL